MRLVILAIFAFIAGMAADGALRAKAHAEEVATLKADNASLAGQVGASCAPVYGVWWLENVCPGLAGGFIPAAARAAVCPGRIQVYRSDDVSAVRRKAQEAGPGAVAVALEERGVKEAVLPLTWDARLGK